MIPKKPPPRCKLLAASLLLWLLPAAANPPGPVDLLEAFRLGQNPAVEVKTRKLEKRRLISKIYML